MSDQPRFELFAFWRTSAGYRVRVALNLKGLAAQTKETFIDIDAGEQRSEAFLKINPLGGIPAFIDHETKPPTPITQSLAILEYLDEVQPMPPLLPDNASGRARVRSLCQMLAADTHPLITPRVKKYLTTTGKFDDAQWRAWQVQWFTTGVTAIEQRLATEPQTGTFCHGDSVSMADIVLASIAAVMRVFKIEVPGTPTVNRIVASCEALDAFAKAAPSRQVGAPKT